MSQTWSPSEINVIVENYFHMLQLEINAIPYSKAENRRRIAPALIQRSEGSIEFKHQNISAILKKYGLPWIIGYKPRSNYQKLLETGVLGFLVANPNFEQHFEQFANNISPAPKPAIDFSKWQGKPPVPSEISEPIVNYRKRPVRVNYLEREQQNTQLGNLGEKLVLQYEKWRLNYIGKPQWVNKIEWVAQEQGDGLGFDILSRNKDGTDRYIEVKTTKLGKTTPIYFTRNELHFSQEKEEQFHLYRVYQYGPNSRLFSLNGRLDHICKAEPISFVGKFQKP